MTEPSRQGRLPGRRKLGWHPSEIDWRIAALFMAGSSLFAIGSLPAYAARIDVRAVGVTFVIGSILFTAAGYSQFYELINRPERTGDSPATSSAPLRRRYWAVRWDDREWWATTVQLFGTLMFNVTTVTALNTTLDVQQENRLVWAPDMLGSVAFLVASHLAWMAVCGGWWSVRRNDVGWWIAALNYIGSIFFMASAVASRVLTTTGDVANLTIVNTGTFLGAVCFFAGADRLLPAPDLAEA